MLLFRARTCWEGWVFKKHQIRGSHRFGLMHCWNRNEFFFVLTSLCSRLYLHAPEGWRKASEGPSELCIPILVVFTYVSHYLLRDSSMSWSLRNSC